MTGGTTYRTYDGVDYTDPATVSDFRLDRFEITVGRFRKFVAAYSQGMVKVGSGRNPNNANDPGWDASWNASLPADATALTGTSYLKCDSAHQTWTDTAGANESLPINCIDWYEAYAFCIWDGGRLPTEAEWTYAAVGGSAQRMYPWGTTIPGPSLAVYDCYNSGIGTCASAMDIASVGSLGAGDGKYGQADLAGNVWEWTQDLYATPYASSCSDCATLTGSGARVVRGGGFADTDTSFLLSLHRNYAEAFNRYANGGSRCARSL